MIPILPYLPWEMRLYLDLMHRSIEEFSKNEYTYTQAVARQLPLTVNQFRRSIPGVTPHPDERGDLYVFADNIVKDGDDKIPPEVLAGAWNKIVLSKAFMTERSDQDSFEFLTQYFAELYSEAKQTGLPIFNSFKEARATQKQEG